MPSLPPRVTSHRILHVIGSVDPKSGGPIEGILRQDAATNGIGVREIATLDTPDSAFLKDLSIRVYAFGERVPPGPLAPLRRKYGYAPQLVPWLRAHAQQYDMVVVNGLWNFSTWAAARALVGSSTPYVVYTHGMLDPWFRRTYPLKHALKQLSWWLCEGRLLNGAKNVLFTTEEEKRLARGSFWGWAYNELVVGYGTAAAPSPKRSMDDAFRAIVPDCHGRYILYLSRIHEKKGCDILIRAYAASLADLGDVELVIAGPGDAAYVSRLKELSSSLGVGHLIHWPGMLSGDTKWGGYYGSEAFILPSHQENFGIVVAEALSCGKPVLITDKVNIWFEVEKGSAGIVENDNLAGITSLLKKWSRLSTEERIFYGASARRVFDENFDVANVAPRTISQIFS